MLRYLIVIREFSWFADGIIEAIDHRVIADFDCANDFFASIAETMCGFEIRYIELLDIGS